MARKKKSNFWSVKKGCKAVGGGIVQAGKEYSSIVAYAGREIPGQPHDKERRQCTLKKGWFE